MMAVVRTTFPPSDGKFFYMDTFNKGDNQYLGDFPMFDSVKPTLSEAKIV